MQLRKSLAYCFIVAVLSPSANAAFGVNMVRNADDAGFGGADSTDTNYSMDFSIVSPSTPMTWSKLNTIVPTAAAIHEANGAVVGTYKLTDARPSELGAASSMITCVYAFTSSSNSLTGLVKFGGSATGVEMKASESIDGACYSSETGPTVEVVGGAGILPGSYDVGWSYTTYHE